MEEKNELVKANQQPIYIMAQPNIQDDEIDLFELGFELWEKKIFIVAITAIITIIAIVIALNIPKTYETESKITCVSNSNLNPFNYTGVTTFNNNDFYKRFYKNLRSYTIAEEVFKDFDLYENIDIFIESIKIQEYVTTKNEKNEKNKNALTISLIGKNPILISEMVNSLVDKSVLKTKQKFFQEFFLEKDLKVKKYKKDLELMRVAKKRGRLDKIEILENADNLKRKEINDKILILKNFTLKKWEKEIKNLEELDNIAKEIIIEKIVTLKELSKKEHLNTIIKMQENLEIAQKLNIKNMYEYKMKSLSNSNSNISIESEINWIP